MQFIIPFKINSNELTLDGDEAFHISKVLRYRKGDEIKIFDGENQYIARITDIVSGKIHLVVKEIVKSKKSIFHTRAFMPFIERKYFEYAIKTLVEYGVDEIIPVITERTQKNFSSVLKRKERIDDIIISAVKQSERNSFPVFHFESVEFKDIFIHDGVHIVGSIYPVNNRLYSVKDVFEKEKNSKIFNITVGPEGGYSENEINFLAENENIYPVKISNNVIRSENAITGLLASLKSLMVEYD